MGPIFAGGANDEYLAGAKFRSSLDLVAHFRFRNEAAARLCISYEFVHADLSLEGDAGAEIARRLGHGEANESRAPFLVRSLFPSHVEAHPGTAVVAADLDRHLLDMLLRNSQHGVLE
jgi:hypothetical protein